MLYASTKTFIAVLIGHLTTNYFKTINGPSSPYLLLQKNTTSTWGQWSHPFMALNADNSQGKCPKSVVGRTGSGREGLRLQQRKVGGSERHSNHPVLIPLRAKETRGAWAAVHDSGNMMGGRWSRGNVRPKKIKH